MENPERDLPPRTPDAAPTTSDTPAATAADVHVVVVTGGTAGVGRAAVRRFAAAGYDVAVIARGQTGLDATRHEVEQAGQRCLALSVDVSDSAALDDAAQQIERELGPISIWVNNAFVGSLSWFSDVPDEEYRRITEVTYLGQVNGMRAALRHMTTRDRGSIINVSSALAHRSIPLQAAYCGAKHAVVGATESLRTELRAQGSKVTVSLVTLPGVNTPQFRWNLNRMPGSPAPVPPLVQPEVAAAAILFAAVHPRANTWVGVGTVLTVLGGRFAPAFMDFYLAKTGPDSQQTDRDTARVDHNLYEPADQTQDMGARGPFDDQSATYDPVLALTQARAAITLGLARPWRRLRPS